jgi:hypothetical protein
MKRYLSLNTSGSYALRDNDTNTAGSQRFRQQFPDVLNGRAAD